MKPLFALALLPACLTLPAQDALVAALAAGRTGLELRARYQQIQDADAGAGSARPYRTGNALSNRTFLSFESGPLGDLRLLVQASNVAVLGDERYNSGLNNRTSYAAIKDPALTELQQALLSWHGLKVGRQLVSVDSGRFLGTGDWSQTLKAYTGLTYTGDLGRPGLTLNAGHLTQQTDALGVSHAMRTEYLCLRAAVSSWLALTGAWYGAEDRFTASNTRQHRSLKADGRWQGVWFETSYAQQRPYRDGGGTPACGYRQASLGYAWSTLSLKAVHEALEPGFNTPQASLHSLYGLSDRVSTTPTAGLCDDYLQVQGRALGLGLDLQAHRFQAERGHQAYGKELDLILNRALTGHLTLQLGLAEYRADPAAPKDKAFKLDKDLRSFWVQTCFRL